MNFLRQMRDGVPSPTIDTTSGHDQHDKIRNLHHYTGWETISQKIGKTSCTRHDDAIEYKTTHQRVQ